MKKNNIETFTFFTDSLFVIKKYNYNNISENNQKYSYNEKRTYRLSSDAPSYKLKKRIPNMEPHVFFSKSDIDGKTKRDLNNIVTEFYNYVAYNSSIDNKKVAKFKYYDGKQSVPIDITAIFKKSIVFSNKNIAFFKYICKNIKASTLPLIIYN